MGDVKFIRKNGRVIPIHGGGEAHAPSHGSGFRKPPARVSKQIPKLTGHAEQFAIGAVGGALSVFGAVASNLGAHVGNMKAVRAGKATRIAAGALYLAGDVAAVHDAYQVGKRKGVWSGIKHYAAKTISRIGGSAVGGAFVGGYMGNKVRKGRFGV